MRKEYEMDKAQFDRLADACKPVPYLVVGGHPPLSPQEQANRAWAVLGRELGFDPWSVQPVAGKDERFFTAEPC
mgnify:CR=1 FL=1